MLQKELGLSTWEDLLLYFPYRHIDRTRLYRTTEILPEMPYVQLRGQFVSMETVGAGPAICSRRSSSTTTTSFSASLRPSTGVPTSRIPTSMRRRT